MERSSWWIWTGEREWGMELQDQTHHPIIIEAKRWESKRGKLEEADSQKRWARKAKEQKKQRW